MHIYAVVYVITNSIMQFAFIHAPFVVTLRMHLQCLKQGLEIGWLFTKRRKILSNSSLEMYSKFVLANHFCSTKS